MGLLASAKRSPTPCPSYPPISITGSCRASVRPTLPHGLQPAFQSRPPRTRKASVDPTPRGPDWMKINPVAGSLFHEKRQLVCAITTFAGSHGDLPGLSWLRPDIGHGADCCGDIRGTALRFHLRRHHGRADWWDLVNDRVVPLYDARQVKLCRVLTDRGTEYCCVRTSAGAGTRGSPHDLDRTQSAGACVRNSPRA
jgi:hypothetical protein